MDAPPPPVAPPMTPGPIPDPRAGRLPVDAKTVAWLNVIFGACVAFLMVREPDQVDAYGVAFTIFLPLGLGVLVRSNIIRILARIAHAMLGGVLVLGLGFTLWGLLSSPWQGAQAPPRPQITMMVFLLAFTILLAAFFVWGFFVLGRTDVRAACRRRSIEKQTG